MEQRLKMSLLELSMVLLSPAMITNIETILSHLRPWKACSPVMVPTSALKEALPSLAYGFHSHLPVCSISNMTWPVSDNCDSPSANEPSALPKMVNVMLSLWKTYQKHTQMYLSAMVWSLTPNQSGSWIEMRRGCEMADGKTRKLLHYYW